MFGSETARKVLESSKKKTEEVSKMKKTLSEEKELQRVGKEYRDESYERLGPAHVVGGSTGIGLTALGFATANPAAIAAGLGSAAFGVCIGEYDKSMEADNIRDAYQKYLEDNEVEIESEEFKTQ